MTVRELKKKLEMVDNDAQVFVEANDDPAAAIVVEFDYPDGDKRVYIADNTDYLDGVVLPCIKKVF